MPLPEQAITELCDLAAATDDSERFARFRRVVVDVETLLWELRWHIGHAILLIRVFPEIGQSPGESDPVLEKIGMPNRVWLNIRPLLSNHSQVFYSDLRARTPGGGTVAGWVLHMLVDDAVSRAIGTLDRLAQLVILAADVPAPRGRMYFRSGKFKLLTEKHHLQFPDELLSIAGSPDLEFLLDYRDGLAHTVRPIARAMRTPPTDSFVTEAGGRVQERPLAWTAADLIVIAALGFRICIDALTPVTAVCRSLVQPSPPPAA